MCAPVGSSEGVRVTRATLGISEGVGWGKVDGQLREAIVGGAVHHPMIDPRHQRTFKSLIASTHTWR